MKILTVVLCLCATQLLGADKPKEVGQKQGMLLQHIVAFKFKEDASDKQITEVVEAFGELPAKIKEIQKLQAGVNNSPEGLNKDFTHVWIVSFKNEADRKVYLEHPAHLEFVGKLRPIMEDVFVIDFWGKQ